MPKPPPHEPIGLQLARTAKAVSRAFDEALAAAGGSGPMWLILLALKRRAWDTQAQLAEEVGIRGPTLTHHLDALEESGLVTRRRDPTNRRVHLVELTDRGDEMFHRLREAAMRHDQRLRADFDDAELERLRALLTRLQRNVTQAHAPGDGA